MDLIGFSTGSLARSNVLGALRLLRGFDTGAVELSALRFNELRPLLRAIPGMDLSAFSRVSVHAPSAFAAAEERSMVEVLLPLAQRGWSVIAHPDCMCDFGLWRTLGSALCVENMDPRKPTGRTVAELRPVFARLPEASFCLDLAHTRQCDPSMVQALTLLHEFGDRLAELHVSDLDAASRHVRLTPCSIRAYQGISAHLPDHVPVIIEAPVHPDEMEVEMELTRSALGRVGALA